MSVYSGGFFSSIVTASYSFLSYSLFILACARLSVSGERKKRASSETASERKTVGRLFGSMHRCPTSMHVTCISSWLSGLNQKNQWLSSERTDVLKVKQN